MHPFACPYLILIIIFQSNLESNVSSWQQQPVTELRISQSDCSSEEKDMLSFYWPGTGNGCQCSSGTLQSGSCCCDRRRILQDQDTKPESCSKVKEEFSMFESLHFKRRSTKTKNSSSRSQSSSSSNEDSCDNCCGSNVSSQSGQSLSKWQVDAVTFQLCGKLLKDKQFIDIYLKGSGQGCGTNFKKCGLTDFTATCVPNNSECPITSIQLTSQKDEDLKFQYLEINQNNFIKYGREEDKFAFSQVRHSKSTEGVCNKIEEVNVSGSKWYPLTINDIYGKYFNDCSVDKRFKYSGLVNNEQDLLVNNWKDWSSILSSLPGYENHLGVYRHYTRDYLSVKFECRTDDKITKLIDFIDETEIMSDFIIVMFSFTIVLCLLLCCCQSFAICHKSHGYYDWYLPMGEPISVILGIAKFIIFLIIFIFMGLLASEFPKHADFLDDLIREKCFDDSMEEVLKDTQEFFGSNHIFNSYIAFMVLSVLIDPHFTYLIKSPAVVDAVVIVQLITKAINIENMNKHSNKWENKCLDDEPPSQDFQAKIKDKGKRGSFDIQKIRQNNAGKGKSEKKNPGNKKNENRKNSFSGQKESVQDYTPDPINRIDNKRSNSSFSDQSGPNDFDKIPVNPLDKNPINPLDKNQVNSLGDKQINPLENNDKSDVVNPLQINDNYNSPIQPYPEYELQKQKSQKQEKQIQKQKSVDQQKINQNQYRQNSFLKKQPSLYVGLRQPSENLAPQFKNHQKFYDILIGIETIQLKQEYERLLPFTMTVSMVKGSIQKESRIINSDGLNVMANEQFVFEHEVFQDESTSQQLKFFLCCSNFEQMMINPEKAFQNFFVQKTLSEVFQNQEFLNKEELVQSLEIPIFLSEKMQIQGGTMKVLFKYKLVQ